MTRHQAAVPYLIMREASGWTASAQGSDGQVPGTSQNVTGSAAIRVAQPTCLVLARHRLCRMLPMDLYGSALGTAGAAPYRREKWLRYRP
jgi:hypothetical protein